ncbi:hypothetical protein OSC52_15430 [Clostridium pasteurianum]|uniref:hypothetical protein n=1 Tax=Clostridium pasteurianum TaxID=1501 RepID=UPI002260B6C5|nr:hypothetical protein [Clostridium pasteurianum]UZW13228.1 hypothetical protein OSC52_15430 [Clostridium pasteurianum]
MINIITSEQASKIIENRIPLGQFLLLEKGSFVAIDNQTGNAWTEDFTTLDKCLRYLQGEDLDEIN